MMLDASPFSDIEGGVAPTWLSQYVLFFHNRRAKLRLRLGTTIALAVAFGPVLGWAAPLIWFLAYALLQVTEQFCFDPDRPWLPQPSRRGAYGGAAFLLAHAIIWCAMTVLVIHRLGAWGLPARPSCSPAAS